MAKSSRLIILILFIAWSDAAYAESPVVREAADLRTSGEGVGIIDFCGVQGETRATVMARLTDPTASAAHDPAHPEKRIARPAGA